MALLTDILISTAFVSQEDRLQFLRQKIACANPEELLCYEHLIKAVVYYAKPEDREWFLQHKLTNAIDIRRIDLRPQFEPLTPEEKEQFFKDREDNPNL
jgi:hypothetical protein